MDANCRVFENRKAVVLQRPRLHISVPLGPNLIGRLPTFYRDKRQTPKCQDLDEKALRKKTTSVEENEGSKQLATRDTRGLRLYSGSF